MNRQPKPGKPFFDSTKVGAFGATFWAPLAAIVLMSLVDFSGGSVVARAVQGSSEVVSGWVPLIDAIAETRQNDIGIRIALSFVVLISPFVFVVFIFRIPRSIFCDRVYGFSLVKIIWSLFWFWGFFVIIVLGAFYAVLPASDGISGGITGALDPLFGVPVVAAVFLYFVLYWFFLLTSALVVILSVLISDLALGKRE